MKSPKVIKGKNILKVLTKKGWVVKSRDGSHLSMSNGTTHITLVLPLTTIGVYKKICKITGISFEEFL